MRYRTLGRTGITVSEIGFGAWGIGGGWGPQNDDEAIRALRRAYDLGVTFFDTALGYGNGHSEQLIARALGDVRDKIVIATKIPPKTYRWPVLPHEPVHETFPADWIIACTEQSLRNLKADYVDVQQLHAWTPPYTDQLEWYEALSRLKESGKVRAFGVSSNDWDPYGPVGAVEAGLLDTVQVIYNIFEQRPAERLLPAAQAHNVGIIVRVPFEEGLLTGELTPDHRFAPDDWRAEWLTPERLAAAAPRVEALKQFLTPDRPTLASLALKFCLSHPAVSTVIPGMRSVARVETNCTVSDGVLLDEAVLAALKEHAFVHGWAYPWAQGDVDIADSR
ncbi:aldo/keto reductase [Roseiflexus sp.]|uniref:aldo/keto reductase n=1 Tax=Roseiflexus sp. TaxID=2562120 RepID=UPI00398BBA45